MYILCKIGFIHLHWWLTVIMHDSWKNLLLVLLMLLIRCKVNNVFHFIRRNSSAIIIYIFLWFLRFLSVWLVWFNSGALTWFELSVALKLGKLENWVVYWHLSFILNILLNPLLILRTDLFSFIAFNIWTCATFSWFLSWLFGLSIFHA